MTEAGCSAHPEPGGHSELLATNGELICDLMLKHDFHLFLQWPTQMAQQPCCEHASPVQDGYCWKLRFQCTCTYWATPWRSVPAI